MSEGRMTRRDFVGTSALAAGSVIVAAGGANATEYDRGKILNYNENMEYRRLGKTGLMVSAVCLGGHWKRAGVMLGKSFKGNGYLKEDLDNVNDPDFLKNRHDILSRCIDAGMNYVDACTGPEVLAYSKAIKGRRDKIYFGYSWAAKESRRTDWRSADKLIQGLDEGLRESGLDYVDLWRITLPEQRVTNLGELRMLEEGAMASLEKAKKQGKARFTGVSTHNRAWLASMIKEYDQLEVVLSPYTASTKVLPQGSLFDVLKQRDVGVFGIKPFADNSLFVGDSSPNSQYREQDDRRARLAIRYILGNPAITAPIAGLVTPHQVDNVVKAVQERRELDLEEKAELERITEHMWANLAPGYQWLRDWEYV